MKRKLSCSKVRPFLEISFLQFPRRTFKPPKGYRNNTLEDSQSQASIPGNIYIPNCPRITFPNNKRVISKHFKFKENN